MQETVKKRKNAETASRSGLKQRKKKRTEPSASQPLSWQRSEAILHTYGQNSLKSKEGLTGYEPLNKEKEGTKEVLRLENSYGNISVGVDRKKTLTLLLSEKRQHNEENTVADKKQLNMHRKKKFPASAGYILTNSHDAKESTIAFKGKVDIPLNRILQNLEGFSKEQEGEMLEERMPFLTTKREKEELSYLEGLEKGKNGKEITTRKEHLKSIIVSKQQLEQTVEKKLDFAIRKSRKAAKADDSTQFNLFADGKEERELDETDINPDNKENY